MSTVSKRSPRVAAQLRDELARQLVRELADPRLQGVVITRVLMSADLRVARVFYRTTTGSMGGVDLPARKVEIARALERAGGRLRRAVTARLGLRFAPEMRFAYDEGQDARDRIDELLEEVKRDRGN